MTWTKILLLFFLIVLLVLLILLVFQNYTQTIAPAPENFKSSPKLFTGLYKILKRRGWAALTGIPGPSSKIYLNFAYPDRSQLYFISSFEAQDKVQVTGAFPQNLFYWALALYDEEGLIPVSTSDSTRFFYNDTDFPSRHYNVEFSYSKPFSLVVRFYASSSPQRDGLYQNWLPTLTLQGTTVLKTPPLQVIKTVSEGMELLLAPIFGKHNECICPTLTSRDSCQENTNIQTNCKNSFPGINIHEFFLISSHQLTNTFPNPNGIYLIMYPPLPSTGNFSDIIIRVQAKFPNEIGPSYPLRYFSYMASNATFTNTDGTIGFGYEEEDCLLPPPPGTSANYTIWFGYNDEKIKGHPLYHSGDALLLFHEQNHHPLIVLRQICVCKESQCQENCPLFLYKGNTNQVGAMDIKKVMGETYPASKLFYDF